MRKRLQLISAAAILAIICFVIATRPDRPSIVAVAYDPSDTVSTDRSRRFLKQLDTLSREAQAAQFVLEILIGEQMTLRTASGDFPVDDKGKKLLDRVEVFYPSTPQVAERMLKESACLKAVWVVSTDDYEKPKWAEVLSGDKVKSRIDGEPLSFEQIEAEIKKVKQSISKFALVRVGKPINLPDNWTFAETESAVLDKDFAVVFESPHAPPQERVFAFYALIGEQKPDGFDLLIHKDTATIAAYMARQNLDKKKTLTYDKPPFKIRTISNAVAD